MDEHDKISQLQREVHVVKTTQVQLAQAVQQNTQVFADAFQMTDCHIHVMQRAVNDMLLDQVYRTGDGGVDFSEYMAEYWAVIGFSAFVARLCEMAVPATASSVVSADEDVIVFGGNV